MRVNWKTLMNGLFMLGAVAFAVWMVVPWGEFRIHEHPTGIANQEDEEDLIDHWVCGMHPSFNSLTHLLGVEFPFCDEKM